MDISEEPQKTWPPRIWSLTSVILVAVVFIGIYIFMSVVVALLMADAGSLSFGLSVLSIVAGIIAAVLAVLTGKAIGHFSWQEFGFRRTEKRWYWLALLIAPGLVVLRLLVAGLLLALFPDLGEGVEDLTGILLGDYNTLQMLLMAFLAACVAPISEEMFFRGYVYGALRMKLPVWASILIGSAIFAGIHLLPLQMVTAFVIALVLAWLYESSKSLVFCIILHVTNNALALILTVAATWLTEQFPDLTVLGLLFGGS